MAKLFYPQLASALKKGLSTVYLISGDEILLVNEACDSIRQAAKAQGFDERQRFDVEAKFDWSILLEACNSLSLFSSKKIIELHVKGKLPDAGKKALIRYLERPSNDVLLLLIFPKLDSSASRSQWVKIITEQGNWLPVWPLNDEQLVSFLQKRLQQKQLRLDPSALRLLIEKTEGNLLASAQEIEKLSMQFPSGSEVSGKQLLEEIADSSRHNVFDWVDKVLLGKANAALNALVRMREEGSELSVLLWAITKEVRLLLCLHTLTNKGIDIRAAMDQQNIWRQRQGITQQAWQRLNSAQLEQALLLANGIDQSVKGVNKQCPWTQMNEFVLLLVDKPLFNKVI